MNLTAGATLQNHKYVIQKQLRQSDLGVTYEAQHAYLAQTVGLQTFNETMRQRSDFAQLRQQFLSKVRSIVQQPKGHAIRVLDCFEEDELPFVVLEIVPGQPLPLLSDWLSVGVDEPICPTQLIASEAPAAATPPLREEPSDPLLAYPLKTSSNGAIEANIGAFEETQPPTPGYSVGLNASHPLHHHSLHPQKRVAAPATVSTKATSTLPTATVIGTQVVQRPVVVYPRSKAWIPLSLIFLSITGAIVGAGFGLSLRLSSTAQSNATRENVPSSKPRLFSREQSFPSDAEWPVSEPPESYLSDPTPIEEPVYRVPAIENYVPPDLPPLPSESGYQDPVPSVSPSPAIGTATPTPDYQPAPLPVAPVEEAPLPVAPPPQISAPPILVAPEAVEPMPSLSEPSEPAPPAPEPALPLLPPTDPAIIKQ